MAKTTALTRILNSKIFLAFLSLLIAMLVWMYVTSTEGVEIDKNFAGVPVVFYGEESLRDLRGLIITNVENSSVTFNVSGSRTVLSQLDATDVYVSVDVSNITRTGSQKLAYSIVYPSGIDTSTLSDSSRSPVTINFDVEKLETKTVEIRAIFDGSVAEGYSVEEPVVTPSTVLVSGSAEAVSKVEYGLVVIGRQDVDRTLSFDADFDLFDADGNIITDSELELSQETVNVTMTVLSVKDVPLSVTVIDGGGATIDNADIRFSQETIQIAGDAETLEGINKIIVGTIDLSTIAATAQETFQIVLDNNVQNLTGITEVTVTVLISGLETRKFIITNFSCINNTTGYEWDVLTTSLEVRVRGTSEELDALSSDNIRAVADLSGLGNATGTMERTVRIYIDGAVAAAAFGEYTIYIEVSRSG